MRKVLPLVILAMLAFASPVFSQQSDTSGAKKEASGEKAKRAPIFRPTKAQIIEAQTILKAKGLYNGEATGKLNDETRAAIKVVQDQERIRATGTLNRVTLERLGIKLTEKQMEIPVTESSMTPAADKPKKDKTKKEKAGGTGDTADKPKRGAVFRANKEQISEAQRILKSGSFYDGPDTGKLDKPTREGLKKYQEANSLKVTGTLNKDTLVKMGIELTEKQKEM